MQCGYCKLMHRHILVSLIRRLKGQHIAEWVEMELTYDLLDLKIIFCGIIESHQFTLPTSLVNVYNLRNRRIDECKSIRNDQVFLKESGYQYEITYSCFLVGRFEQFL